jgi:4-amino-4-deoxy-L-arabinose transferase-like glycosyltransferase
MAWLESNDLKVHFGLMVLCILLYLPGLTTLPPIDRDEARFAQASRQMLESRDFVRIRFQEEPRHKKPIGIYWLQAGAVAISGYSGSNQVWPYRIPSLLGAAVAAILTFTFGKGLFDRMTAALGAIVLASSLLLVVEAHQATTDAALLAAVVAAQGSLGTLYVRNRHGENAGRRIPIVFWTAQGIGILLKGPILPMVSLLTILALRFVDGSASYLRGLRVKLGIPWVMVMVAPWAIAVTLATDGAFFGDAVRSDLLPKIISGHQSHGFPPGFYLLIITLAFWPGSLFLWPALRQAMKLRFRTGERFCLAWIIPAWSIFELIPTKLPHYILPVFPALSLVTARLILTNTTDSWNLSHWTLARIGFILWILVSLSLAGAIVALPVFLNGRFDLLTLLPAGAAVALLILAAKQAVKGRLPGAAVGATALAALILIPAFHVIIPNADGLWLSRSVAKAVNRYRGSPHAPAPVIAAAGYHEPSLVFLCGTETKLVEAHEAALHLHHNPNALALVTEEEDPSFRQAVSGFDGSVQLLERIRGFSYAKCTWLTLYLYSRSNRQELGHR